MERDRQGDRKGQQRTRAKRADLEAFESRHGVQLPAAYRTFVLENGAGELLAFVRIHAPRAAGRLRLDRLVDGARNVAAREGCDDLRRFVPFADTAAGDAIGWKTAPNTFW